MVALNQYLKQIYNDTSGLGPGIAPCDISKQPNNICGPIPLFGDIAIILYFADTDAGGSSTTKYTFDRNKYKAYYGASGDGIAFRMQILENNINPNSGPLNYGIIVDYYPDITGPTGYWKVEIAKSGNIKMRINIDNLKPDGKYDLSGGIDGKPVKDCSIQFCTYSNNLLGVGSNNKKNKCYVKYVCGQPVIVNGNCGKKSKRLTVPDPYYLIDPYAVSKKSSTGSKCGGGS